MNKKSKLIPNSSEAKFRNNIEKALEQYSNHFILRSLINGIPIIGSHLDLLLSIKGQETTQKRIELLIRYLTEQCQKIEERKVDKSFIDSDDFFDLTLQAVEAAARSRHREKIRLYASIIAGSVVIQDRSQNQPEDYLAVVSELSMREVSLVGAIKKLKRLEKNQEAPLLIGGGSLKYTALAEIADLPFEDIEYLLVRIQRTGLVQRDTATRAGGSFGFEFTPLFDKFTKYIDANSFSEED